jgi:hypothetical protein
LGQMCRRAQPPEIPANELAHVHAEAVAERRR